jgi:hypothetical protein
MPMYWLRPHEYDAIEFTGDIDALRTWAAAQDISGTETVITRIDPFGETGFQIWLAYVWTPEQEFQYATGSLGDFVVNEWGQLNVRAPEAFNASYIPVTEEP